MRYSIDEADFDVRATKVQVTDEVLTVELDDGRTIALPVQWFPRLRHGTPQERANVDIGAFGISWPDLEEDLSYKGLILGRKSGENPAIIKYWLDNRKKGRRVTVEDWMKRRLKRGPSTTGRRRKSA